MQRLNLNPLKRIVPPLILLAIIFVIAITCYTQIEHWRLLDAIYMIVITLSTVGFREVHELSDSGRIITMCLIIFGVGTVGYTVGQLIEMMVEGQIIGYRRMRNMEKMIHELKNHYIICGFGRVGKQVAKEFDAENTPYVVIDSKPETAAELGERNIPYIIGDMVSDEILESASIMKAKGLIACADSDASNVYVTLSARGMNPGLNIVARASTILTEDKLRRAGANRVISPYFIAGNRMASMVLRPVAVDFLDMMTRGKNVELEIEEYKINSRSKITGKTLKELQIKQKSGAMILAIKHASGKFELQPGAATVIDHGDVMVGLGTAKQLEILRNMAEGN
jgi:voltage-gated potassium channel